MYWQPTHFLSMEYHYNYNSIYCIYYLLCMLSTSLALAMLTHVSHANKALELNWYFVKLIYENSDMSLSEKVCVMDKNTPEVNKTVLRHVRNRR
jgi:hypothetical protein